MARDPFMGQTSNFLAFLCTDSNTRLETIKILISGFLLKFVFNVIKKK